MSTPQRDFGSDSGLAPVEAIPTDAGRIPEPGIALCLSGGGYRAMLFHLGAIWRLNEVGVLGTVSRISSVSGGSILAGVLGLTWSELKFDKRGVAPDLEDYVVKPVRALASRTIDLPAIVFGALIPFVSISGLIAFAYKRHLFGRATLQQLPDVPRFVLNATNLQSGALWRFMKPYVRDYRVGEIQRADITLAKAVAASSAFPPLLSPARFKFKKSVYTPGSGQDLQFPPYTTRVRLTDGGVYDNLGLETAWKRYRTVLISDGGGRLQPEPKPWSNWISQSFRVEELMYSQIGNLRKRQVIAGLRNGDRDGTYWGIWSHVSDYPLSDPLPCDPRSTTQLARVPTRLAALAPAIQERLINWGYAICDTALRTHVDATLTKPPGFPYARGV